MPHRSLQILAGALVLLTAHSAIAAVDGCDFTGHYWVFYAATTTAGFSLTVEDTFANEELIFVNPDLQAAEPVADILAFATCDASGGGS